MNSPIHKKIAGGHLLLISAAIAINASPVFAADGVSDAQGQARDPSSGALGGPKAIDRSLAVSAEHYQKSYADPQKQARRIIVGKPSFDDPISPEFAGQSKTNVPVPAPARPDSRDHTDPQESARQIIVGKPSFDDSMSPEFAGQSKTNVPVPAPARPDSRDHTDPQESARQIILGREDRSRRSTGMRLSRIRKVRK